MNITTPTPTKILSVAKAREALTTAFAERTSNLPKAIQRCHDAMAAFTEANDDDGVARACSLLGLFHMIRCEFAVSLEFSQRALQHFEKVNDTRGIADAKYNIAGVYYKSDNFHTGLDYLLDCLTLYRQLGDSVNEARVLKSMGTVYEYFGDQDNAIASYEASIEAAKRTDDRNAISNAYCPLSGLYLKRNQADRAMTLAEEAIAMKRATGDTRGLAFATYARGKVHQYHQRHQEALTDFEESCDIHHRMGEALGQAMALNKLGLLHYQRGHYDLALEQLTLALQLAKQVNVRFVVYKANYNLYLTYRAAGRQEEALRALEQFIREREAVVNSHTYHVVNSYKTIQKIQTLEQQAMLEREKTGIIEKKNAELDSFFYRVSHDLKGPISSLLGLHTVAQMEIKDPMAQQYMEMYHSQVKRINNIVMDLINLTRLNNPDDSRVRIDFNRLLDECIQSYAYLANYPHITFLREVDSQIDFHCEWAVMNTILQNLIENSIKYARPNIADACVRIDIRQQGAELVVQVTDNGQGIAPEHHPRVFDMFYRANTTAAGTGLGLYILKRAVERLHGKVSFTSAVNCGTTFTVTLPMS